MTINKTITLAAAVLVLAGTLTGTRGVVAGIKCWKNDEGVRECGNSVPPQYVQKGHQELSSQGVTVHRVVRAKTPEELERERAETERLAMEKSEADRAAHEQGARDRVLLHTFTTEEDLILTRDGKLDALDSRIKHVDQIIDKLNESLEKLQTKAANLERNGKPVPEKLREDIATVEQRIADNRATIDRRHAEKKELTAKFDADLSRYRELKGQ